VDGTGVAIVDVGAGLSMFRLAGEKADGILSELCAIDLDPRAFPDRRVVQMPLANVRVTLARLDRAGNRCFDILVPRDYAGYLWEALLQNGKAHGLAPVGPTAFGNGVGQ
jgi:heterotetrameric sarcosine oxidase gamma subunit